MATKLLVIYLILIGLNIFLSFKKSNSIRFFNIGVTIFMILMLIIIYLL